MTPDLFWIPGPWPGRLAISNRPRGGDWLDDEIRGWRDARLDMIVSLLENEEERQLGLGEEGRLSQANRMRFVSFPIPDRGVPMSARDTVSLLANIRSALEHGHNVAVHCRQGVGRSAVIAAGALMNAGVEASEAMNTVGAARGLPVPETPQQREWLRNVLADHLALASR
jgi:protein-tyrosine phosphatase